jgi:hypothetical protein
MNLRSRFFLEWRQDKFPDCLLPFLEFGVKPLNYQSEQFAPAVHLEMTVDELDVHMNGVRADAQRIRRLFFTISFHEVVQDLPVTTVVKVVANTKVSNDAFDTIRLVRLRHGVHLFGKRSARLRNLRVG